jgi:hypothetical protein
MYKYHLRGIAIAIKPLGSSKPSIRSRSGGGASEDILKKMVLAEKLVCGDIYSDAEVEKGRWGIHNRRMLGPPMVQIRSHDVWGYGTDTTIECG